MGRAPDLAGSVHGLRAWRIADGEVLTGLHQGPPWPDGGAWLEASCAVGAGHPAPAPGCTCGIHGWHPRPASARRVLAGRFEVPGIVEAAGAIELHEAGFRAQRARVHAVVLTPRGEAARIERLAARHGAGVLRVRGATELLEHCVAHGLGLDEAAVAALLGPDVLAAAASERRRRRRRAAAGVAATAALIGGLVAGGTVLTDPPAKGTVLHGRAGSVTVP